ncbi:MAG: tetratricopeptide repeat protein, partial [Bacteroidetes bacterium]|nr:tetratricopeptide repeat protein [Bacteroidota bacterium]
MFCALLSVMSAAFAQKTTVYSDPMIDYRHGLSFFDEKNYGSAQEKFGQVLESLNRATEQKSDLVKIHSKFYYAICAYKLQQPVAEHLMLDFVEKHYENPKVRLTYYYLGDYYFKQKRFKKAINWFEKVDPDDLLFVERTRYHYLIGYTYFSKKRFEEAQPHFEIIRSVKGKYYYSANYYFGFISYFNDDHDLALVSFNKLQESKEYGAIVPYYISQIYFLQQRYQKLISFGIKILDNLNVDHMEEISYLVGQAYFQTQQYSNCIPFLADYVANSALVRREDRYQLAYAQYKSGVYFQAISNFQALTKEKDSLAQNATYNLANCYLKTNKKREARIALGSAS